MVSVANGDVCDCWIADNNLAVTMASFSPSRRLSRVDLPAFGCPRMATTPARCAASDPAKGTPTQGLGGRCAFGGLLGQEMCIGYFAVEVAVDFVMVVQHGADGIAPRCGPYPGNELFFEQFIESLSKDAIGTSLNRVGIRPQERSQTA